MVGNTPNFTKIDILRCFLRFNRNLSRHELSKELELGEGTIRTILNILKSKKLLQSTKHGHSLSKKGFDTLNRIYENISLPRSITAEHIYNSFKKVGIHIRNALNLKEVYKLRDIAVKNGAEGALILKFYNELYVPESRNGNSYKELERYFDFKNDDVLVVAFANDNRTAENSALAVAIEMSGALKNFISQY